jgi:hypothetical protein
LVRNRSRKANDSTLNCKICGSDSQRDFNGEIAVNVPKGSELPIVWVFPKLLVCLNCGSTEFQVPQEELRALADKDAPSGSSQR